VCDVEFVDGTRVDLLPGRDESSDFTFTTEGSALIAAQSLLGQVFLDGPLGLFDSAPRLPAGGGPSTAHPRFDCRASLPLCWGPMARPDQVTHASSA